MEIVACKQRKNIRLKYYNYARIGMYYVTICTQDLQCIFGKVVDGKMILNGIGEIARDTWLDLVQHNHNIKLDEYIIMPNHVHGIINIVGAGSKPAQECDHTNRHIDIATKNKRAGLEPAPTQHGLPEIVRQFKTFSAMRINKIKNTPGKRVWQRNYYEHIIRNETKLNQIREYILNNPLRWNNKYR